MKNLFDENSLRGFVKSFVGGKIHVYTGNGKGKTTVAFGLAMRASGRGFSVLIIQFLKKGPDIGEVVSARLLPGVRVEQYGTGEFVNEDEISEEDKRLAQVAMDRAKAAVLSKEADIIILDELNVAIHFDLVPLQEALELIDLKPENMELIITGRHAKPEVIAAADYVTELLKRKHPYDSGGTARLGIEY